jgi:predicted DNA-binding protein|tara:strand:+ start:447 stop:695 length:249 start_codon:yes stop_codon:yes gene_type:complete
MAKYKSRATRLADTLDMTEKIADVEQLKEELEEWLDNLPENLQSSNKAEMLQEAIDNLENIGEELENIQELQHDVEFPGMFS